MRQFILFLVIFISSNICHADDCMYDQAAQIEFLKSILKSLPGGVLNLKTHTINWTSPTASANSIQYGGCEHLGFSITKNIPKSKKYTEAEVFSLVESLAKEYWSQSDSKALSVAIAERSFSLMTVENSTFFHIPREYYSEFHIEQNFTAGFVAVRWVSY